jgi:hypothetical protein
MLNLRRIYKMKINRWLKGVAVRKVVYGYPRRFTPQFFLKSFIWSAAISELMKLGRRRR